MQAKCPVSNGCLKCNRTANEQENEERAFLAADIALAIFTDPFGGLTQATSEIIFRPPDADGNVSPAASVVLHALAILVPDPQQRMHALAAIHPRTIAAAQLMHAGVRPWRGCRQGHLAELVHAGACAFVLRRPPPNACAECRAQLPLTDQPALDDHGNNVQLAANAADVDFLQHLAHLDLTGQESLRNGVAALSHAQHLTCLRLGGTPAALANDAMIGLYAVGDAVQPPPADAQVFIGMLAALQQVQWLDLSHNASAQHAGDALAPALANLVHLTCLEMRSNTVEHDDVAQQMVQIWWPHLQKLDLSGGSTPNVHIDDGAHPADFPQMPQLPLGVLTHLDLQGRRVGHMRLQRLLKANAHSITSLGFSALDGNDHSIGLLADEDLTPHLVHVTLAMAVQQGDAEGWHALLTSLRL